MLPSSHHSTPLQLSRTSSLTSGSGTPSELEDAFFIDEDIRDQELLQTEFLIHSALPCPQKPPSDDDDNNSTFTNNKNCAAASDWHDWLEDDDTKSCVSSLPPETSHSTEPPEFNWASLPRLSSESSETTRSSSKTSSTLLTCPRPLGGGSQFSGYDNDEVRVSPQRCVASGNALYCGFTRRALVFEVRTLHAGEGFLSVTIQGPRREAVLETRVILADRGLFRVQYRVQLEGYYIIVVKWADCQVPGSPFLCRITDQ